MSANAIIGSPRIQTLTATAAMVNPANSNNLNLMGAAGAALTFTLPQADGTGDIYRFEVFVVNTSNYIIKVAAIDATTGHAASATMDGSIQTNADADDTVDGWETAATSDTVTLNATTTGGVSIGDWVEFTDVGLNQWTVRGTTTSSGTEATPFSATVT